MEKTERKRGREMKWYIGFGRKNINTGGLIKTWESSTVETFENCSEKEVKELFEKANPYLIVTDVFLRDSNATKAGFDGAEKNGGM